LPLHVVTACALSKVVRQQCSIIHATTNHVSMIPGRAGDDFYDDDDKDEDNGDNGERRQ
jgi:hypothetical protein